MNQMKDKMYDFYYKKQMESKTISLSRLMEIFIYYMEAAVPYNSELELERQLYHIYSQNNPDFRQVKIEYLQNQMNISIISDSLSGEIDAPDTVQYTFQLKLPLQESELMKLKVEVANVLRHWGPILEAFSVMHLLDNPCKILTNQGNIELHRNSETVDVIQSLMSKYDLTETAVDKPIENLDEYSKHMFVVEFLDTNQENLKVVVERHANNREKLQIKTTTALEKANNIVIRVCDLDQKIKDIIFAFAKNAICQGTLKDNEELDSLWCGDLSSMVFENTERIENHNAIVELEKQKKQHEELLKKESKLLEEYNKTQKLLAKDENFKLMKLPTSYFVSIKNENDIYLQIAPELLKERFFRFFNWTGVNFSNVSLKGLDLSGSNIEFDPQTIYQKDLTNTNCSGIRFAHFRSWDGVILDGALIDDWEAMIYLETVGSINHETKLYSCYYNGKLYQGFEETSKAIDLFLREKEVSGTKSI